MAREMRRKKQALDREACVEILERGNAGVLSLYGLEGYPYGVPVSYVYDDDCLIFHGAKAGHRLDAVKECPKACFTVIDENKVVPEEYTTYFRSVMAFGEVEILEDKAEIIEAAKVLGRGFWPEDSASHLDEVVDKEMPALIMYRMKIERMTGKQAIELTK